MRFFAISIAVASIWGHQGMAAFDNCTEVRRLAEKVMEARQNGVSGQALVEAVDNATKLRAIDEKGIQVLIVMAFSEPVQQSETDRLKAKIEFGRTIEQMCYAKPKRKKA